MKVLVTGAAGFVGRHIVGGIRAHRPDAEIIGTDRELDVTDAVAVAARVTEIMPDYVVHAAALTPDATQERSDPASVMAVNVVGTASVASAALQSTNLRRLVLISSVAVLGSTTTSADPVDETVPATPDTLYAVSKLAAEGTALRLASLFGRSVVVARLTSVYGHFEQRRESRPNTSHVHRLMSTPGPVVRVAGPNVVRDWVHGDDVGAAIARLLTAPSLAHTIYNVGTGTAIGWHDIWKASGRVTQVSDEPDVSMTETDPRPILSITRLTGDIDYQPRSIVEGLADLRRAGVMPWDAGTRSGRKDPARTSHR